MKISTTAKTLETALSEWAQARGGVAVVVSNIKDMWQQAAQSSDKPRIFICWMGEDIRGPFDVAAALGRVDRGWVVAITRGRGFSSNRGNSLTTQVQNAEPFLDSVESVRDICRSILGISVESPNDYKGIKPMQLGTLVIDGYLVSFSTADDLPQMALQPEETTLTQWSGDMVCVTPSLASATPSSFGTCPAGQYRVYYSQGAMQYHSGNPWQVNRSQDNHEFKVTYSGGTVNAPGDSNGYSTQAACESANAGQYIEFTHTGGDISVYLQDSPYTDNVAGNPSPTFCLRQLVTGTATNL